MNEDHDKTAWVCPICQVDSHVPHPFISDWALACHIAGKAHTGDKLHRSWVLNQNPNVDFKASLPKIAEIILWAVRESQIKESKLNKQEDTLYKLIANIERRLHTYINDTLKKELGEPEKDWWVKGVPQKIRQKCAERQEEDGLRDERFNYMDILDLLTIIDCNWGLFQPSFNYISDECKTKRDFLDNLRRFNEIRKSIMHPVRVSTNQSEDARFLDWFDKLTSKLVTSR